MSASGRLGVWSVKFMKKFRGGKEEGAGGGEYWKLFQCFQGIFFDDELRFNNSD